MCGFLIYEKAPSAAIVNDHLTTNSHRGTDGYGVICVATGDHYKALGRKAFIKKWDAFVQKNGADAGYIVHHRKASVGGVKERLVHPLAHDHAKRGQVLIMQNGTRRELADLFYAESDTAALAELWHGISDDMLYLVLEGCGVVFALDDSGLYFHKDDARTLYYSHDHKMWASEPVIQGKWTHARDVCLTPLPSDVRQWASDDGIGLTSKVEDWVQYAKHSLRDRANPLTKPLSTGGRRGWQATTKKKNNATTGQAAWLPARAR